MAGDARVPEATLLALPEQAERRARWESVPPAARAELLAELARLMLRVAEAGDTGDEARDAD